MFGVFLLFLLCFSVVSIKVFTNWLLLAAFFQDTVSEYKEILTFSQALTFSVRPD